MPLGDIQKLAVQLDLKGNFDKGVAGASKSLTGLNKNVSTTNKLLGDTGKRTSALRDSVLTGVGLGGGVVAFSLIARGIGAVVDGLQNAVHEAEQEDAAIALLTRSIQENSAGWDGNIDAIEDVIAARQDLAFSDDEQRESLRALVAVTKDEQKALDIQRTAMDLARLKGIDLATATTLLGKVYGGNIGILSRYGIQLRKGATATEALAEIQRRAQGQAETYADSALGKVTRRQIEAANASEDLGRALIPLHESFTDLATGGIRLFADALGQLTSAGGGGMPDLIADLRATAGAIQEVADAGQEHHDFPVFDDLVGGLQTLQDAAADVGLLPGLVREDEWRTALQSVQRELGLTNDEMLILINEAGRLGLTLDQTRDSLTRRANAQDVLTAAVAHSARADAEFAAGVAAAADVVPVLGRSVFDVARQVHRGIDRIEKDFAELPHSLRDTIQSGKGEVREAMQDLRFAMEHPFAGDRYRRFLERKQREAMKAMQRALRQGKIDAADEAGQIVLAIQGKLGALDDQKFSVNVETVVSGVGASLAGWLRGLGRPRDTGQNAMGGYLFPGQFGTFNERGPERVSNVGGVTVIEPMRGSFRDRERPLAVAVGVTFSAYQTNRQTRRVTDTWRQRSNSL